MPENTTCVGSFHKWAILATLQCLHQSSGRATTTKSKHKQAIYQGDLASTDEGEMSEPWGIGKNRDEEIADLEAYQRQYEDDHSWEALQEDEFGRLRPLVSPADCQMLARTSTSKKYFAPKLLRNFPGLIPRLTWRHCAYRTSGKNSEQSGGGCSVRLPQHAFAGA